MSLRQTKVAALRRRRQPRDRHAVHDGAGVDRALAEPSRPPALGRRAAPVRPDVVRPHAPDLGAGQARLSRAPVQQRQHAVPVRLVPRHGRPGHGWRSADDRRLLRRHLQPRTGRTRHPRLLDGHARHHGLVRREPRPRPRCTRRGPGADRPAGQHPVDDVHAADAHQPGRCCRSTRPPACPSTRTPTSRSTRSSRSPGRMACAPPGQTSTPRTRSSTARAARASRTCSPRRSTATPRPATGPRTTPTRSSTTRTRSAQSSTRSTALTTRAPAAWGSRPSSG